MNKNVLLFVLLRIGLHLTTIMKLKTRLPNYNSITLSFRDESLEKEFVTSYDRSVRLPLRNGIFISLVSWYSSVGLIFSIIPEKALWLVPLTLIYIGSYFGFIIYSTYNAKFTGFYHFMGAISSAWAGVFAIYFCDQFPSGSHLVLPILIFIIFFGSYMVRLRWFAGFIAAASYIVSFQFYLLYNSNLSDGQIALYSFIAWVTLAFAFLAGRMAEINNRLNYIQRRTIKKQSEIILAEKEFLLKEVHHRVKNNLQVILSLINMQLRSSEIETVAIELRDVQSRVLSMSTAHQWLRQQSNFSEIQLSNFIKGLIQNIESLYETQESKITVNIDSETQLDIEKAIPLGLLMNELFSLNYKLSNSEGLEFLLTIEVEDNVFKVDYRDQLSNSFSGSKLGCELMETLSEQIDAEIKVSSLNGNQVVIQFDK